jgi:hypothetical protein
MKSRSSRLAKSYRPDKNKTKLEAFEITQLRYPLSDRIHRFPMPAGGLFSTGGRHRALRPDAPEPW